MSPSHPTALIADDEPLLREGLQRELAALWPELVVVASVRNGREAIARFAEHRPDICFLDVQMPGLSGLEAARALSALPGGERTQLVLVTAFDEYAVDAFGTGVVDYLVKPVAVERLARCVQRLQGRLAEREASDPAQPVHASRTGGAKVAPERPGWLRAQSGHTLHVIPVDRISYLRSDSKYTRVAWCDHAGVQRDALVRQSLKSLCEQLPPEQFLQIHRSVIVNLHAIAHLRRGDHETAEVHLHGRSETLPVSRAYLPQFSPG